MVNALIEEKLKLLPGNPGVYLMKDENNQIIYVGKAKNLKNRVRQYFQNISNKDSKTVALVKKIRDFDFIVTDTEIEALVLECNLIKEYRPKFNILLRDDKYYLYFKITNEEYPRLILARRIEKDKATYFGPFVKGVSVRYIAEFLRSLFQVRTCNLNLPSDKNKKKPCLNYHIKKCSAPCNNLISQEEYNKNIEELKKVLNGKGDEVIKRLQNEMNELAEALEFEKAAILRDNIRQLKNIVEKQKVIYYDDRNEDIINYAKNDKAICYVVLVIRNGKLINKEEFFIDTPDYNLQSFLEMYYSQVISLPKEIIIPEEIENKENIEGLIEKLYYFKSKIRVPKIGEKKELIEMSKKNAEIDLLNKQKLDIFYKDILSKLSEISGLDTDINKIESYDISNISGNDNVASMVVFENGRFIKDYYRKFRIKTVEGQDDYGSIREVIQRRFTDIEKHGKFPDAIFIDGGIGQVNTTKEVLKQLNINIPVFGMVKDDRHKTKDLLYEGKELNIQEYPELYKLVYQIQEETHRFAIKYHKQLRSKHLYESILDEIDGIGEKRKIKLFRTFGSIDNLRQATVEEISKQSGIPIEIAERIKRKLTKY
ncbi:excinuclease ABC subunit UvrC [Caldicellulosiruptoraceae bacterium PP1]